MKTPLRLADHGHPLVKDLAARLTQCQETQRQKIEAIFLYVRDDIAFGFPAEGDMVPAWRTIELKLGQCNTKTTLFVALCRAAGIQARAHFSLISRDIQRGLFRGVMFRLMPREISHSWAEVLVDGRWVALDGFINDMPYFLAARRRLRQLGWDVGLSVACNAGDASADFDLTHEKYVQMAAVTTDQGVWDEPGQYYASGLYANRPGFFKLAVYRLLLPLLNARVAKLRNSCPEPDSAMHPRRNSCNI